MDNVKETKNLDDQIINFDEELDLKEVAESRSGSGGNCWTLQT